MSTDLPEGNEPQRGTTGRTPRVGDSRSPVGSTLSIILAVVAVVAGFFILRELTDDDGGAASTDQGGTDTDNTSSANSLAPTGSGDSTPSGGSADPGAASTVPPVAEKTLTGASIVVVNASGVGGSAATMSSAITTAGYEGVGEPGNTTGEQLSASIVHYVADDAAAQAVARSIAADLGGVEASAMPDPRPAEAGDSETATVLVMLGTDAAGQSLADLSGDTAVAPPAVVGGSTPTETTGG